MGHLDRRVGTKPSQLSRAGAGKQGRRLGNRRHHPRRGEISPAPEAAGRTLIVGNIHHSAPGRYPWYGADGSPPGSTHPTTGSGGHGPGRRAHPHADVPDEPLRAPQVGRDPLAVPAPHHEWSALGKRAAGDERTEMAGPQTRFGVIDRRSEPPGRTGPEKTTSETSRTRHGGRQGGKLVASGPSRWYTHP